MAANDGREADRERATVNRYVDEFIVYYDNVFLSVINGCGISINITAELEFEREISKCLFPFPAFGAAPPNFSASLSVVHFASVPLFACRSFLFFIASHA